MSSSDEILRAITNDGAFRVIAGYLSETIDNVLRVQSIGPNFHCAMGELLLGAALVRETTAPNRRVQFARQYQSGTKLIADSHADGMNRGIIENIADSKRSSSLTVSYSLRGGALYQSVVDTKDTSDMASILVNYMETSEQIVCVIQIASQTDALTPASRSGNDPKKNKSIACMGFIVQLLPEAEEHHLREMVGHLEEMPTCQQLLAEGKTPREVIDRILSGQEYTELAASPLFHGCTCSRERFFAAMAGVDQQELKEMAADKKPTELQCDVCKTYYHYPPEEIGALIKE